MLRLKYGIKRVKPLKDLNIQDNLNIHANLSNLKIQDRTNNKRPLTFKIKLRIDLLKAIFCKIKIITIRNNKLRYIKCKLKNKTTIIKMTKIG